MRQHNYTIYLIETPCSWYVGATTRRPAFRFQQHMRGQGGAPLLWAAAQRLGVDAFTYAILETGIGDPMPAEQHWYDVHRAAETRACLNTRRPGAFPDITAESRAKIAASRTGVPSPRRGVTHTAETRQRMHESSPYVKRSHCSAGHPYDETTYVNPRGHRRCRICIHERAARQSEEKRTAKKKADVAVRKLRYANDPEYRARILASNREYAKRAVS